tara:strand:+ start:6288 stop:8735 length:2448 start_codon:yes stop_codon:yes gene_type:complete
MNLKNVLLLSAVLLLCINFKAQTTIVSGRIFDGETGKTLPYVNVSFSGTSIGTMTNGLGEYELESERKVSRVFISFIGYTSQSIPIQKQVRQTLDIALEEKRIELEVAEVRPDKKQKNPAKPLMQRVAEAKLNNDPAKLPGVSCNYHEKLQLSLNDIPEKLPSRKIWGAFGWIWDGLDSSDARVALPTFFSESTGTVRTQKSPRRKEQRVDAARATWFEDGENSSSVTAEFLDINLYENQLLLMDKAFTSPLHDRGNLHYRYYILDTITISERPAFHLAFVPRRRGELTFEGELWIDTLTLALSKVEAKISEGANINFIRSLRWKQEYSHVDGSWVLEKREEVMDVSFTGSSMGFYARSTVVNTDFEFGKAWPDSVWSSRRDLSFAKGSNDVLEQEWKTKRPEPLLKKEHSIYSMADSVMSMRQFKFIKGFIYGMASGNLMIGKIELGPWYYTYSKNLVEGHRIRLSASTSNKFSKTLMPKAYVAYGTLDKKFKYKAQLIWIQRKIPRIKWFASYSKDVEQFGMLGFFNQGNIFNSALSVEGGQNNLTEVVKSEASYLAEFGSGWSTFIELRHRNIKAIGELVFIPADINGNSTLITAESTFQLRYAHGEKFVAGAFDRVSLGSKMPIVTMTTTQAWKNIGGSQYRYARYTFDLDGTLRFGPFGRIRWNTNVGMYSGTAPFALMELQPANETAISIVPSFNLLRYFEFVTDKWARVSVEWHGEGAILNHIPFIRRAGIREVVGVKGVMGSWDPKHEALIALPEGTTGLNGYYAEGVVGLENILDFFRVDYHFRLTESSDGMRQNHGIRVGFSVEL